VEVFHLVVLDQIGRKVDKPKWVLKGGCNLRFYFRSPRYSDDMDLDVQGIPIDILREKMRAVLSGRPFQTLLEVRGISVEHMTEHKQTDTTQRWKFGLSVPGQDEPVPTKIEFSRRGHDEGIVFEPVSPEIVRLYELPHLLASHYDAPAAWRQKTGAILSRAASQARDVFDLHVLLGTGRKPAPDVTSRDESGLDRIKESVLAVDFGQFKSQVISYLEPDLQPHYDSEKTWDAMRWRIIEALGEGPS